MKLFLFAAVAIFTVSAFAQTGHYCNCYHKDGSAITVSLEKKGKVSWGEEGNLAATGIGYQLVTRTHEVSELARKYISSRDRVPTNLIASAEVFKLVKHPTSQRERNLISFLDAKGKLLYMTEERGERIMKCEGRSFCASNW